MVTVTETQSFMPHGSTPQTAGFTCNTCGLKFVAADMQRRHMKTEWHRYNLKRRVAQLPAISSDVFAHKILQIQKFNDQHEETDEFGFPIRKRKNKKEKELFRGRSLESDLNLTRDASPAVSEMSELSQFSLGDTISLYDASDSNFETESEFTDTDATNSEAEFSSLAGEEETESEAESVGEFIEVVSITNCFYCGVKNHEVERNIKHMSHKHGLYLPERSYLEDLEGLLTFLAEVIHLDNECLVCGFQGKNLESIRQHMELKGHCRIPYETQSEKEMIAEFYNFDNGEDVKSGTKKHVSFADNDSEALVQINSKSSSNRLYGSNNDSAVLPTGVEIGHRNGFNYRHPPAALVRNSKESQKSLVVADRRYAPGLSYKSLTKQEKQTRRLEYRNRNLEVRRNTSKRANFQEHFRDEFLQ